MLRDNYTLTILHRRSLPSFREPVFKATYSYIHYPCNAQMLESPSLHHGLYTNGRLIRPQSLDFAPSRHPA